MVNIDMNIEKVNQGKKPLIIITGEKQCGKTTTCSILVSLLKDRGFSCGGVLSPGGETRRFHLLNSDRYLPFSPGRNEKTVSIGKFRISARNFDKAKESIIDDLTEDVLFIDEIGLLEMDGQGFYPEFIYALEKRSNFLILTCRKSILSLFIARHCSFLNYFLLFLTERNSDTYARQLFSFLNGSVSKPGVLPPKPGSFRLF